MARFNVRRLAAVDMHGGHGTSLRRRLILAEFLLAFPFSVAVGITVVATGRPLGWLLGAWALGCGLNYVPLAWYALALRRPGALAAELAGVDAGAEGRYYTVAQLWVVVPLALVAATVTQRRRGQPRRRATADG